MTDVQLTPALRSIRKAVAPRAGRGGVTPPLPNDCQLLAAFAADNDQGAFAQIVRRHGPAVLGVCRRVLQHVQDAEDAFQATFLVLARKAGSVRRGESLAAWLHGASYRIAMRAKRDAARRRKHERQAPAATHSPTGGVVDWREVQAVLDEEVERLPPAYRAAFVLCCLSGLSQADAARQLGIREGTVSSRLTRARQRLQAALTQRGITLSAVLAALALTGGAKAAVSGALADATGRASVAFADGAAHKLSAKVLTLAEGALQTMFAAKMKLATVLVLTLGLLGAGAAALRQQSASASQSAAAPTNAPEPPAGRGGVAPPPQPPVKPEAKPEKPDAVPFAGRVHDPDGKPVKGAKLFVRTKDKVKQRATTGADGRFRLMMKPADIETGATLIATADGFGPDWIDLKAKTKGEPGASAPGGKELTLRLVKDDVPITGRVLDLEGKPVAGASVRVDHIGRRPGDGDLAPWIEAWKQREIVGQHPDQMLQRLPAGPFLAATATTTGKDGRFRLEGFGRGRAIRLRVQGKGLANSYLWTMTRTGADKAAPPFIYSAAFDLLMTPGKSMAGTVRDRHTGKPVAGVKVSGAVTDEQGRYRRDGLRKRKEYSVSLDGRPAYFLTREQVADTPGLETIQRDFAVERGVEVRGRLTDKATGKPIRGQLFYLAAADNPHLKDYKTFGTPGIIPSVGYAKSDGTFHLPALPGPGMLCVTAADEERYVAAENKDGENSLLRSVPSYFRATRFHAVVAIDVPNDKSKPFTRDIALEPGRTRTGKVVGPDGKPLPGAYAVGLRPLPVVDGNFPLPERLDKAECTAHGLNPRKARNVVFFHPEKKLGKVQPVRGDEGRGGVAPPLTVKLEPLGGVTGRILDANGRPWAGLKVRVELSRRLADYKELPSELIQQDFRRLMTVEATTDRDGRFRIEGLLPGLPYNLAAFQGKPGPGTTMYYVDALPVEAGKIKDLDDLKSKLTPGDGAKE